MHRKFVVFPLSLWLRQQSFTDIRVYDIAGLYNAIQDLNYMNSDHEGQWSKTLKDLKMNEE